MKLSCPLALLVLFAISFILAACGLESQPATPTIEQTITETPQPSLTPAPTEIPLPEGAEELIDRLGEKASAFNYAEESFELIYDGLAIGVLSADKFVYCPGEEIRKVSYDSLEILDGYLVSINRQKTKEMGVDWVEYAWINGKILPVEAPTLKPILFANELITNDNIDRLQVLQIEGLGDTGSMLRNLDMYNSPENNSLMVITNSKISYLDEDTLEELGRIEFPSLYQQIHPDIPLSGFPIDAVAVSKDLHSLATLFDGSVSIWDIQAKELISEFKLTFEFDIIEKIIFLNYERLAVQSRINDGFIRNVYIFDLNSGDLIKEFEDYSIFTSQQIPDQSEGSQILLTNDSQAELFDISDDQVTMFFVPPPGRKITSAVSSPNLEYVAVSSKNNGSYKVHVYRVSDGALVFADNIRGRSFFSDDGTLFAYTFGNSGIRIMRVEDWSFVQTLYAPAQYGYVKLAFSKSGEKIAAITVYGVGLSFNPAKLYLWDIANGSILLSDSTIFKDSKLIFSNDEENLFVFERDDILQFQLQDNKKIIHPVNWTHFSVSSDNNFIAAGGIGESVSVWNLSTGNLVSRLGSTSHKYTQPLHNPEIVLRTEFSANGQMLAAQTSFGSVLIYDLVKNELSFKLLDGYDSYTRIYWMAFSHDGTKFAAFDGKYSLYLWDVLTGQVIIKIPTQNIGGSIYSDLLFTNNDLLLVANNYSWDISDCELIENNITPRERCGTMSDRDYVCAPTNPYCLLDSRNLITSQDCDVASLAVSPNKEIAVVGCFYSDAQVFNLVGNKYTMDIPIKFSYRAPMIFSPDGKFLILDDFIILGIME